MVTPRRVTMASAKRRLAGSPTPTECCHPEYESREGSEDDDGYGDEDPDTGVLLLDATPAQQVVKEHHDDGTQGDGEGVAAHAEAFSTVTVSRGLERAITRANIALRRKMPALIGLCDGRPPARSLISTPTWRTSRPAREAMTSDSTVSPRYSAG